MKYKVRFQYGDERFGFDAEPYTCICERNRYFKSFNEYQGFLQQIDMAGDETTRILAEEEISDFRSNLYILRATLIFLSGGWFSDKRINKFYDLLEKSLVDYFNMPIARWMDIHSYQWEHRNEVPEYMMSHFNYDFIGYSKNFKGALKCWFMYLFYDHEITRIEKIYREEVE